MTMHLFENIICIEFFFFLVLESSISSNIAYFKIKKKIFLVFYSKEKNNFTYIIYKKKLKFIELVGTFQIMGRKLLFLEAP